MRILNCAFAIFASLCFIASCSNNDVEEVIENDVKVEKTFGVSAAKPETRAYIHNFSKDLMSPGQSILWDKDRDKVTVFAKGHTAGDEFEFNAYSSPYNKATFTGKTFNTNEYFVLYPAQSNAKLVQETDYVQFTIPDEQNAIDGTFDPDAGIQIGHINSSIKTTDVALANACAYFCLTVKPDGCTGISIESLEPGFYLAGTVRADVKSGGVIIKEFVDGKEKITLNNISRTKEETYIIAFIPSNSHPGVKVNVSYPAPAGNQSISFAPAEQPGVDNPKIQFVAGGIYDLGDF